MLLRLIYIVIILVTFAVCKILYMEKSTTTIKEIHHYHIYDTKENYERKKAARKLMKEILYGYKYEPILPKKFFHYWGDPPGVRGMIVFPGGERPLKIR